MRKCYRIYENKGEGWTEYATLEVEEDRIVISNDNYIRGVGSSNPVYELYVKKNNIAKLTKELKEKFIPKDFSQMDEMQKKTYGEMDSEFRLLYSLLDAFYETKDGENSMHIYNTKTLTEFCRKHSVEIEVYEETVNFDWGFDYGEDD